jgi:CheY-like chemotaxis protein
MKSGPVIILEDDIDDQELLESIFRELNVKNKLIWFTIPGEAFNYLKTTSDQPFIIFCDVNLPMETGINFKKRIDDDPHLRKKSIPFVFYSTSVDQKTVNEAYTKMTVQGFFQKGNSFEEIKKTIRLIIDYWMLCKHPNAA